MARFSTRKAATAQLEEIIKNAEKELILISPYVKIDRHTKEDLLARKDEIEIHLIYGKKKELDQKEREWLESMASIRLSFHKDLHAKCYLNESQALLTSMNLHDFSQKNNIEMGIFVSCGEDPELYDEIRKEAESIIKKSDEIRRPGWTEKAKAVIQELVKEPYNPGQPLETPKRGFCIRCKNDLPANPAQPYCTSCYRSWDRFKNDKYEEQHCHTCGKKHKTTLRKPLCFACYKKYEDVFEFEVSAKSRSR